MQDSVQDINVSECKLFFWRRFAYFLVQHASSLPMGTTKIHQDYISPLMLYTVLDSTTNWTLRHLQNRVIIDMFHINRHKLAFVPTLSGVMNTQGHLN